MYSANRDQFVHQNYHQYQDYLKSGLSSQIGDNDNIFKSESCRMNESFNQASMKERGGALASLESSQSPFVDTQWSAERDFNIYEQFTKG